MVPILQSFDSLVATCGVEDLIKSHHKYLAHTPDEKLADHMALVRDYFLSIVQCHGLEPLIDNLCLEISDRNDEIGSIVKKLFWNTVLYHDFGKLNENFQRVKMRNPAPFVETDNGIETQHSILSAYLFLIHQYSSPEFRRIVASDTRLFALIAFLSHNILRHHSAHLDDLSDRKTFQKFTTNLCAGLVPYLDQFSIQADKELVEALPKLCDLQCQGLSFEWFLFIRLNFSLLTATDYYATSHYCENWAAHYREFGTLCDEQKQRHYQNLKYSQPYNRLLYDQTEIIRGIDITHLSDRSADNLNKLRLKMAEEVLTNIRANGNERLFYLEAPTGGGKTNLAFIAACELLEANPELTKVYFVFPFTTIVTQTKALATNTLLLQPDELIELHSKAPLKEQEQEAHQDGLYAQHRLNHIDNRFVNYPYVFLTHVRFFDILTANDKNSIYLLHRLANSVVVIDEVQAYNPLLWDKMAFLLKHYAALLNIRFIVMSATLPKIGETVNANFKSLLPDAITRFFINPNFAGRVTFDDSLAKISGPNKEDREQYLHALAIRIHELSETYRIKNGTVRSIVEFIFKKSATEFAEIAKNIFFRYEILVLSGTILEPRRKEIINYLKTSDSVGKNILLITTQVVEAGIDIDMDLGFKNRSIIDSEEQLAGRVNRNATKTDSKIYLFNLDDPARIYGSDRRYREWQSGLNVDYLTILQTKRFDIVYDRIKAFLNQTNQDNKTADTLVSYTAKISELNFPDIEKGFRLIDQKSISVFVPTNLPINLKNGRMEEPLLTRGQVEFLTEHRVLNQDQQVSGERVFDLYRKMITNRENSFTERKRNVRLLQSVMSLFTFSLFSESNFIKELESGGNSIEFGYLYLVTHKEVYSYSLGLLDHKFNSMIFI